MKEIKLTIDGKEVQLTDEQLKMLGIETRKRLFDRVDDGGPYYFINCYSDIEADSREDDALFDNVNYFNDMYFAYQVALHQLLYRKLLKFAYENNCEDIEWNSYNEHWCIYYNPADLKYDIAGFNAHKFEGVWFSSEEGAKRAIKEVVEPFIKEHPEFVW